MLTIINLQITFVIPILCSTMLTIINLQITFVIPILSCKQNTYKALWYRMNNDVS
jgi:hypothetical protein